MRKLLCANADRLKKLKIFWGGIVFLAASGLVILFCNHNEAVKYGIPLPDIFAESLFESTMMMGIVFAVFSSLYIGTEYDNGTIRNKLMIGQSRTNIYLSNSFCCIVVGMIQIAAAVLAAFAVGIFLEGMPGMTAMHFLKVSVVALFLCISYMSIYNLFAMLVTSKSHAAIVNILLAFVFLFFASYLYNQLNQPEMITNYAYTPEGMLAAGEEMPNPYYISGNQRVIYQFLFDFLPGGQNYQIANYGMQVQMLQHPALLCFYSAVIAVGTNLIGIFMFHRKDIK